MTFQTSEDSLFNKARLCIRVYCCLSDVRDRGDRWDICRLSNLDSSGAGCVFQEGNLGLIKMETY